MIPLFHDLAGETVLVVGGGPVGARKARRFAAEARVVVLSPSFEADGVESDDAASLDFGDADLVREAVDPTGASEWIRRTDPALVVAATDDADLNAEIARIARQHGVLVNRADVAGDDRPPGSVVVPATVEDGDVTVAISTGGASPALSKHLRERLEDDLADAGAMADLTADLREELKASGVDGAARRDAIRAVVRSDAVWTGLDTPGTNARQIATDVISNVIGDST